MKVENRLNVKTIFRNTTAIGCTGFTIWLAAVQFFKYKENEDLSKLSYRRFIYDSTSESSPPTYTICISKKGAYHSSNLFKDPSIAIIPNISNYGYEKDYQLYYDFLAGNLRKKVHNWKTLELLDFDSEMTNFEKLFSNIEFEDFSIDLIDDLLHQFISGTFSKNYYLDLLHECNESLSPNVDCMSTLMPKVHQNLKVICYSRMFHPETDNEMSSDFILLNTSKLFEMGLDLSLHVHQTGQLIRHLFSSISPEGDLSSTDLIKFGKEFRHKIESNPNKKNTQNTVHLTINDVTILRKRKNSNTPCDDKSKNEDERVRSFILNKLGCVPAYWNIFNTNASSQKEMKSCGFIDYESMNKIKKGVFGEFKQFFDNYTHHNDELCSDMRRSVTNFEESTTDVFGHWIELVITYLNKDYMEIRNIEAYTMESLLGQVGGFVGK